MEYFIECGRRRKGERSNCKLCGTEFFRRINAYKGRDKKEYCTRECASTDNRNRVTVFCANCNKQIERTPDKMKRARHGLYFCTRECKDFAQSLRGNCLEIRPPHYGNGYRCYRNIAKDKIIQGCVGCAKKTQFLLVVHHIDGNRDNNSLDNLECVCHNCHAVRHMKFLDGEWKFGTCWLTPRDKIDEIMNLIK